LVFKYLVLAIRALDEYQSLHNALPPAWNSQAALEFIEIAKRINSTLKPMEGSDASAAYVDHVDLDLLTKISFTSRGQ
jgi:hypothetical protein